jgi:hypothetical protein
VPGTGFPWPAAANLCGASGSRKRGKEREKVVRIRILEENFGKGSPRIIFEAENVGITPTSIKPNISMRGFLPRPPQSDQQRIRIPVFTTETYRLWFEINSADRLLSPHTPVRFEALDDSEQSTRQAAKMGFLWFKTYVFSFTRGTRRTVRIRSADHRPLSFTRYLFERTKFVLTGDVTVPDIDVRLDR